MTDKPKIKNDPNNYITVGMAQASLRNPLDKQIGGDHYKRFPIQPVEYIRKNELGWFEGNIVKYVTRHKFKNGRQDIEKLIHMAECILKEYDDENRA